MAVELDVTVVNRQRGRRVGVPSLRSFLEQVGAALPPDRPSELSVCLVSDRRMREFNRDFRGRDAPTDVLTFPSGEVSALDGQLYLGDIAVSVPTAVRQARERGHTLNRELKILVLHGYLHLLGFDHERDGGKMMRLQRRLERKLLRTGGTAPLGRRA